MKYLTKQLRVRLPRELDEQLYFYMAYYGKTKSETIRDLLKSGLMLSSRIGILNRLVDELRKKNPDPMNMMIECEKCGNENDLLLYHIDENVRNLDPKNLIVLCKPCFLSVRKYIQKYNAQTKFVEWFYNLD